MGGILSNSCWNRVYGTLNLMPWKCTQMSIGIIRFSVFGIDAHTIFTGFRSYFFFPTGLWVSILTYPVLIKKYYSNQNQFCGHVCVSYILHNRSSVIVSPHLFLSCIRAQTKHTDTRLLSIGLKKTGFHWTPWNIQFKVFWLTTFFIVSKKRLGFCFWARVCGCVFLCRNKILLIRVDLVASTKSFSPPNWFHREPRASLQPAYSDSKDPDENPFPVRSASCQRVMKAVCYGYT